MSNLFTNLLVPMPRKSWQLDVHEVLREKVAQLVAEIQKDYPGRLPPIHLIASSGTGSPFRYLRYQLGVHPPGIYVSHEMLSKLDLAQAVFAIGHEFGHHYLENDEMVANRTLATLALDGRSMRFAECKADQFAAHYMARIGLPYAPQSMGQIFGDLANTIRGGKGLTQQEPVDSVHPPDTSRQFNLLRQERTFRHPSLADFNQECVLQPPPTPPGVPITDGSKQR